MKTLKIISFIFLLQFSVNLHCSAIEEIHGIILYEPEKIGEFIKQNGENLLHTKDNNGWTPLMYAINYESNSKDPIATQILIELKSDVNSIGPNDDTPLMYAIRQKNEKKVALICSKNPNINTRNFFGKSAKDLAKEYGVSLFVCAAKGNNFDIVKSFIENEQITENEASLAVLGACQNNNVQMLNLILSKFPYLEINISETYSIEINNAIDTYINDKAHYQNLNIYPEKEMVVVIPSYNNEDWCIRCLQSVVEQDYSNFTIIYRDDYSSDKTLNYIIEYVKKNNLEKKVLIKRNDFRRYKAANLYLTIHGLDINYQINDSAIVVIMDGDDHFPNKYILKVLNKIYHENDVYFTYGGYVNYPSMLRGFDIPTAKEFIDNNTTRLYSYQNSSQLRTFYAWLFKKIKLSDFFYEGKFMTMVSDVAKIFPMLELVGHKHYHINFPVYMYNRENVINDDKVNGKLQYDLGMYLRSKPIYKRLENLKDSNIKTDNVDIVVLAENFESVKKFLGSNLRYFINYKILSILYNGDYQSYHECCLFPYENDFKEVLISVIKYSPSNNIFICTDSFETDKELNFKFINKLFQLTDAFGFYANLKKYYDIRDFEPINNDVAACQFKFNLNEKMPFSLDGVLYNKEMLLNMLLNIEFNNIEELKKVFIKLNKNYSNEDLGLFFL